jgi:hypothetical protein
LIPARKEGRKGRKGRELLRVKALLVQPHYYRTYFIDCIAFGGGRKSFGTAYSAESLNE